LAAAAEHHALERYGVSLGADALKQIDEILDQERERGNTDEREAVALCYGAWLGQYLVPQQQAEWTGFDEPVPPRIQLRGICHSPIDAVRRRLADPAAPTVQQLVTRIPQTDTFAGSSLELNRAAWNQRAADARFARPEMLTASNPDAIRESLDPWLANLDLRGLQVLCLAAGGGTHGPLFAQAGSQVTVVDFSSALLAIDAAAARRLNLELSTVQADLCDLSSLSDRQFDVVIQPVSACYIASLQPMYKEIARVIKPGGLYVSQHKSPAALQAGKWDESRGAYLVAHPAADGHLLAPEPTAALPQREAEMVEYVHTLASLLGALCRSGFVIEDVHEPARGDAWARPGTAEHRAVFLPPYLKVLARRVDEVLR
jgi:SAM-dependent methyltransferase